MKPKGKRTIPCTEIFLPHTRGLVCLNEDTPLNTRIIILAFRAVSGLKFSQI